MSEELPKSIESERGILSSILLKPDWAMEICLDKLQPEHFHHPGHCCIYKAIVGLHSRREGVDQLTLTAALQKARNLAESGGPAYLMELETLLGTAANLPSYIEIVIDMFHRREMLKHLRKMEHKITDDPTEIQLAANDLRTAIKAWEDGVSDNGEEITHSGWLEAVEDLEAKSDRRRQIGLESALGISTPWATMNRLDYGIQEETFTIIAACTSQGKTKLLLQVLAKAAHQGVKSLFFSMEESKAQVIQELLCQEQAMTTGALDGYVKECDFPRIGHTASTLRDLVFIDDSPNLTVEQIRSRAKRFKAKHPDCKIIAVDHHMLIRHSQRRNATDEALLAEISIGLSSLKKELGVAVFLLCQINREGPKTGRPRMRHIKGSGQFEQDADKLWIIQMEDDNTGSIKKGKLYKDKGRFSPIGEFSVIFSKTHLLFTEGD